jgi:hypothetical protein
MLSRIGHVLRRPKAARADAGARPGRGGKRRGWHRAARVLAIAAGVLVGCVAALWVAIHRFEWMGPLVANSLRAVIGTDNVARLEDLVYALEDRANRWLKRDEKPRAYWKVPAAPSGSALPAPPAGSAEPAPRLPPFRPKDPGPALKAWSAEGDGVWVPIRDPRRPGEEPYLYKTLLHPDVHRGWAEVFVVAVDTRRVDVHFMVGSQEPKADDPKLEAFERPARIPPRHHEELLAAFNGGFMTEHGGYGAKLDGVVLVKPRARACTFALLDDGSLICPSSRRAPFGTARRPSAWSRTASSIRGSRRARG